MARGGWQEEQEGGVTADEAGRAAGSLMLMTWKPINLICIFMGSLWWLGRELVVGGEDGDKE